MIELLRHNSNATFSRLCDERRKLYTLYPMNYDVYLNHYFRQIFLHCQGITKHPYSFQVVR